MAIRGDRPGRRPTDRAVSALWLDQLGRGFAAGQNSDFCHFREALFETRNGGRLWTPVLAGAKHVSTIFGLGPEQVWAVGDVPGYVPNDLVAILRPSVTRHPSNARGVSR